MRSLVRVVGLLLVLAVSACTREEPLPLRVGTFLWPGSEPLFLARELGHLDDGTIRLIEYSSLSEVNRDFRNGRIDAVDVTLDMALQLQQQGFEPRVVLVLDYSHGADALLARPEVRRLEDLRGKRVAVEGRTRRASSMARMSWRSPRSWPGAPRSPWTTPGSTASPRKRCACARTSSPWPPTSCPPPHAPAPAPADAPARAGHPGRWDGPPHVQGGQGARPGEAPVPARR